MPTMRRERYPMFAARDTPPLLAGVDPVVDYAPQRARGGARTSRSIELPMDQMANSRTTVSAALRMPLAAAAALLLAVLASGCSGNPGAKMNVRKSCAECHAKTLQQTARPVVHAPFKNTSNCQICHLRHGAIGALALKAELPKLCFGCHEREANAISKTSPHSGVKDGKCTKCHEPH